MPWPDCAPSHSLPDGGGGNRPPSGQPNVPATSRQSGLRVPLAASSPRYLALTNIRRRSQSLPAATEDRHRPPSTPNRARTIALPCPYRPFRCCIVIPSVDLGLDPELGAKWETLGVRVIQGYGATEVSPVISIHPTSEPGYDSAGLALPGGEVKIADDGEVLVRGPSVTKGYWEAAEQTKAAFVDGWYRTGDQGYLDERGYLHLQGRKKDMIVLPSGQNVYPEDIEGVLRRHPAVTDAAVVGLPAGSQIQVHAALILGELEQAAGVVSWTNGQLAEHQQVRGHTVRPEDDFPRTHTLKVRKGLVLEALKGEQEPEPGHTPKQTQASSSRGVPVLVAEASGLSLERVTPEMALGTDLDLDSLGRVELLAAIEEELGVYLDEGQVDQDTTVRMIEELVEKGSGIPTDVKFPTWGLSWWCRGLRGAIQRALLFPLLRFTNRVKVAGRENLLDLDGPVLFAANHCLFLDNGLIVKAMPLKARRRLAIAASAEAMRVPPWPVLNPLLGNGFPFSREGNVRASLDNMGRILDRGWSVLIYPEGEPTIGGPMKPFKSGPALVAVEGRVPVVPLRVRINRLGSPRLITFLRRSDVEIRFGQPVEFPPGTDYMEATHAIEEAVRSL